MCCEETEVLGLSAAAIEALAHYRRLRDERGWDWGDERIEMFRWLRFSLFGPVLEEFRVTGDWPAAVRSVIGGEVPAGVVVVRVGRDGRLSAEPGPARPAVAGLPVSVDVVIDSAVPAELRLDVAGRGVAVPPRGAAVETIELDGGDPAFAVTLGADSLRVEDAFRTVAAAELRLRSPRHARWSIVDAEGGAWFPEGLLPKWDFHHRPFFHGRDVTVRVPAEPLRVVCARGIEFGRTELEVIPDSGRTRVVECDPPRLYDPAADGWFGGDLHIHMNYSGDLVCAPADAARMQLGEGLHVASLVAGNCLTSLVYDREMLEDTAGSDLPWSGGDTLARMGVEYRNDLFGHVHAFAPDRPPAAYYAGFDRSDRPDDWPPNTAACEDLRAAGAIVGYAHPSFTPFSEDGSTDRFFENPRSVEARELVADAALGLVDSIDLISPSDDEGAAFLYHRLLSCGLRLAATAGTDAFLSFSHGPGTASNPPGWGRVYAKLGDRPLSAQAFKDAVREGRTIVTNGPWIDLDADGHGPGAVLRQARGDRIELRVRVRGPGAERVTIVGPDGALAEDSAGGELRLTYEVDEPAWIAAVARGPGHPNTLDESVFAHTSPVYVDVDGRRVARAADARWCLDFLDTLEAFVDRHGRFQTATRESHLGDFRAVVEQARTFFRRIVVPS